MTPYHERLTVRLREAAEEYRHGQHTGASNQRLVLLMNARPAPRRAAHQRLREGGVK